MTWSHLRLIKKKYWITLGIYGLSTATMTAMLGTFTDLMNTRFAIPYCDAKNYISYTQISQVVLVPLAGQILQKTGLKPFWLIIAHFFMIIGFGGLFLLPTNPSVLIFPLIGCLAIYYSIYCSTIYPLISQTLPTHLEDFGQSVTLAVFQMYLIFYPMMIGHLTKERTSRGYLPVLAIWLGAAFVLEILSVVLLVVDVKSGKELMSKENSVLAKKAKDRKNREFAEVSRKNFEWKGENSVYLLTESNEDSNI